MAAVYGLSKILILPSKSLLLIFFRGMENYRWYGLSYIFHISVVLLQMRVMESERSGKFNHKKFPTSFFWGVYLVNYAISIWYFMIYTDLYGHIYNRAILLFRFMIVFMLSAYDYANHNDFHGMQIVDENQILNGYMDENLYTRKRNDSLMSSVGHTAFDIKINMRDRIVSKIDERTMEEDTYFEFEVLVSKKRLHKLEKRYKDFKAFE